jgi:hypothetical protein
VGPCPCIVLVCPGFFPGGGPSHGTYVLRPMGTTSPVSRRLSSVRHHSHHPSALLVSEMGSRRPSSPEDQDGVVGIVCVGGSPVWGNQGIVDWTVGSPSIWWGNV